MKPIITLAETTTRDGAKLALCTHDGQYDIRLSGRQLMSTTMTHSESHMAEVGCARCDVDGQPRVLIGGLGLGFTLRRTLELVGARAKVEVAELNPHIVVWNREHLRTVNGHLLDDPRVEILVEDVQAVLARAGSRPYDAVLIDVDNGPTAWVEPGNSGLYRGNGLRVLMRALRVGGRAVIWSAGTDQSFLSRLTRAGFQAAAIGAKAYAQAKRDTHTLFVADRNG